MRFTIRALIILMAVSCVGCNAFLASTPTPTQTPSPQPTDTSTITPTSSPTPTATATATDTPTATLPPTETPLPTLTPIPTRRPDTSVQFFYRNSRVLDIPDSISGGINQPLVVFLNTNDRQNIRTLATGEPPTNIVTLYYSFPGTGAGRIPVLEIESEIQDQIYVAPQGNAVAYLLDDPNSGTTGLWLMNVRLEIAAWVSDINSMTQRGLFAPPSWSPDGTRLALGVATGYDLDIFTIEVGGAMPSNLTNTGSYDWAPVWSPDGSYIAFLSDRATCPSWIPGDPNACEPGVNPAPTSGQVYIMELSTGNVTRISDQQVNEPPRWVNARLLAFAARSNPDNRLDQSRSLWLADVRTGQAELVALQGSSDDRINLAESWSPDGSTVLYQESDNTLVLMRTDGTLIERSSELVYPRFGVAASWSPDSTRIAIGGIGSQCPYGRTVIDLEFDFLARSLPPPSMCNPVWSPDGNYIAYAGVIPRATGSSDGRVDIYISDSNGFGATSLTGDLRGQIRLLGWVSGE